MSARLHSATSTHGISPVSFIRPQHDPAALTIDHLGVICDCNETASKMFGFHRDELISQDISIVLPQMEGVEWMQKGQPNPHLSYLTHIGHRFIAVTQDGKKFSSRLFLNDLSNSKVTRLLVIVRSSDAN